MLDACEGIVEEYGSLYVVRIEETLHFLEVGNGGIAGGRPQRPFFLPQLLHLLLLFHLVGQKSLE